MTAIAGLVHEGKVYIGGDSAGVDGWSLEVRKDAKVFRASELLIGFTSSFRMGQILRYHLAEELCCLGDLCHRDEEPFGLMVSMIVPAVRKVLKAGGYSKREHEVETGGTFLVGFRGRLFGIENDYQVSEASCGFTAAGCGRDVARGALHVLMEAQSQAGAIGPEEKVLLALRAAEACSAGVRGPFRVLSL